MKWIAVPARFRWHTRERPIFDDGLWAILRVGQEERLPIATVDRADDHDEKTRTNAAEVARLIASAPELLAALKESLCWHLPGTAEANGAKCETKGEMLELVEAAIRKAEVSP